MRRRRNKHQSGMASAASKARKRISVAKAAPRRGIMAHQYQQNGNDGVKYSIEGEK